MPHFHKVGPHHFGVTFNGHILAWHVELDEAAAYFEQACNIAEAWPCGPQFRYPH